MNIDQLRTKIEEICTELNTSELEPKTRIKLENELEQACISYYKLRKVSA
ncbi:hypothetical protein SDC9_156106 [bioreactor metagenome]|uniref:Spo0E like sporulation regulatory protein n=1 Tax=bioreactor metagenome TaxID=1076179 RepID=A0A645F3I9_9ZZZZ